LGSGVLKKILVVFPPKLSGKGEEPKYDIKEHSNDHIKGAEERGGNPGEHSQVLLIVARVAVWHL